VSGFFLGSLVDRFPKKATMTMSSLLTLGLFLGASLVYATTPPEQLGNVRSPQLWAFVLLTLIGAIAGNLRTIALSTVVAIVVPPEDRDRANGMVGTATGIAFLVASFLSGVAVGQAGMGWVMAAAVGLTILIVLHLATLPVPELPSDESGGSGSEEPAARHAIDIPGTIHHVRQVPGLFGLIFFQTFNNFLGGIYMSLMDAYGLLLVSVEVWGAVWGVLSLGFIVGGMAVARWGLGPNPLRTLFVGNIAMWAMCLVFPLRASIILLGCGLFVWLCLVPAVEAAEQTILQGVVPPDRLGRVIGFAQSVEQAASPVTSFLIGPIAQWTFIPFMTTGAGVELIGDWFGTGMDRGLALLFIAAGALGLLVTVGAMRTTAYRQLSSRVGEMRIVTPEAAASL
jgi:DHA3 family multidrug efflux protein-like MFS transporter